MRIAAALFLLIALPAAASKTCVDCHAGAAERSWALRQEAGHRDQVLFVSSGLDLELYQRVLTELSGAAGKRYRLAFRPHPGERAGAREKYGEMLRRFAERLVKAAQR